MLRGNWSSRRSSARLPWGVSVQWSSWSVRACVTSVPKRVRISSSKLSPPPNHFLLVEGSENQKDRISLISGFILLSSDGDGGARRDAAEGDEPILFVEAVVVVLLEKRAHGDDSVSGREKVNCNCSTLLRRGFSCECNGRRIQVGRTLDNACEMPNMIEMMSQMVVKGWESRVSSKPLPSPIYHNV